MRESSFRLKRATSSAMDGVEGVADGILMGKLGRYE